MGRAARRAVRNGARALDPEGGCSGDSERSLKGLRRESDHLRGGFAGITSLAAVLLLVHAALLGWEHVLEGHVLGAAFQATSCVLFVLSAALVRGARACFAPGAALALSHFAVWGFVSSAGWSEKHPTDHMFPLCSCFFGFIACVLRTMKNNQPADYLEACMYED